MATVQSNPGDPTSAMDYSQPPGTTLRVHKFGTFLSNMVMPKARYGAQTHHLTAEAGTKVERA
jgi:hypothetical protein